MFGEADAKAHLTVDRFDSELCKQRNQVWVGAPVEHEKAGIHRMRDPLQRDVDRVGVPPCRSARLEQGDLRMLGEQPCRGQTRYATADHSHARLAGA